MGTGRRLVSWAAVGITIVATAAAVTSLVLRWQPGWFVANTVARTGDDRKVCTTIATDPNPPLNVRSSPVTAPDNVIGKLSNGTHLTVVDETKGWLRLSSPIAGWVYKPLTVRSCAPAASPVASSGHSSLDVSNTLAAATEQYHAGNLDAAVALAQTIPATSPSYAMSRTTIAQWRQDWKTAEDEFYNAQKALSEGKWQTVLQEVKTFPANRYWRERLTPIVKQAIEQQKASTATPAKPMPQS